MRRFSAPPPMDSACGDRSGQRTKEMEHLLKENADKAVVKKQWSTCTSASSLHSYMSQPPPHAGKTE